MIWTEFLVRGLTLNTVSGSCVFGVWFILSRRLEKANDIQLFYTLLRLIVLFFLFPVVPMLLTTSTQYGSGWDGRFYLSSWLTSYALRIIWLVWLIGFYQQLAKLFHWSRKCREIRRHAVAVGSVGDALIEECCARLGMNPKRVRVRYSSVIDTPLVYGFWRPEIYFPLLCTMSVSERRAALLHEMNHLRSGDTRWRYLAELICCIHWFNPLVKRMSQEIEEWSEACCDYHSGKALGSLREYFSIVAGHACEKKAGGGAKAVSSRFYAEKTHLERRLRMVKSCQNARKKGKRFTAACTVLFLVLGITATWVGAVGTVHAYERAYLTTVEELEVANALDWETEYREYLLPDRLLVEEMAPVNEQIGNATPLMWTLGDGGLHSTFPFYQEAGSAIQVTAAVEPEGAEIQLGIVCPDGDLCYVRMSGCGQYTFYTLVDGYYRVYAAYEDAGEVQVSGCYEIEGN